MSNTAIVIPSVRQGAIERFFREWDFADDVDIIVVEDGPECSFKLPERVHHFSWKEIDDELGEDAWIIPRKTDCVRSFGFLKALELGAETIVTLDDDCYPVPTNDWSYSSDDWSYSSESARRSNQSIDFVNDHLSSMSASASRVLAWDTVMDGGHQRGLPIEKYRVWDAVINVGLWDGFHDLSAAQRVLGMDTANLKKEMDCTKYIPTCGMNLSFKRRVAPAMYFLLMGKDWPFDRYGDIWCGILAKRICDHLRLGVKFGRPYVMHYGFSDPFTSLVKEAPGMRINEYFWRAIDNAVLTSHNVPHAYMELSDVVAGMDFGYADYWKKLAEAMDTWVALSCAAIWNSNPGEDPCAR